MDALVRKVGDVFKALDGAYITATPVSEDLLGAYHPGSIGCAGCYWYADNPEYPRERFSVIGRCGTRMQYDSAGLCFADGPERACLIKFTRIERNKNRED